MASNIRDAKEGGLVMIVVETIPYKTFKERIRIVKALDGKGHIEIEKGYVYIERIEGGSND